MRARHAVLDAWQAAPYAIPLGKALRGTPWVDVIDDAIRAVWSVERSSRNAEIADVLGKMADTARAMDEERTAVFIEGHAGAYRPVVTR